MLSQTELAQAHNTVALGGPPWAKYILWATVLGVFGFAAMRYRKKLQLTSGVV